MAEIIKRNKALAVNPLKASQPVGASLAFMGINRCIPMMHGSQGCTAFAKVYFVRHFREPVPLQTTAMDQVSTVMGADENVIEGLKTLCAKAKPAVIGLVTTGLSETQGTDIKRAVKEFRAACPEYDHVNVVSLNTPDFSGCVESGFALAVKALIEELVKPAAQAGTQPGKRPRQVNVLPGSHMTPGDIESLIEIIEAFGLRAEVIPDLSDSLDGHVVEDDFSPISIGGTLVSEFTSLGDAGATLVIGNALRSAGELLEQRTAVPTYYFDHLFGLQAMDDFIMTLRDISGVPVPAKLERQRDQLQDAMLDGHFMLGQARFAIAADPDLLNAFTDLVTGMGAEVVAATTPARADILEQINTKDIKIGDLEDLEKIARERKAEIMIGSSHAVPTAERLGIPILRAGFPLWDLMGGYQRSWIGYRGARQAIFDLANMLEHHNNHIIAPFRSIYGQKLEYRQEADLYENSEAIAHSQQ